MAAAAIRFLALVALILMPLSMGAAPAMAEAAPAAETHATADGRHCDGQSEPDNSPEPRLGCSAMCTAIAAAEAPLFAPMLKPVAPRSSAIVVPFSGVEPEIATPPPRRG